MKTRRFLQLESKLLSDASLSLTDKTESADVISYYLRVIKGRTDLGAAINAISFKDNFVRSLELIRGALKNNELDLAETELSKLTSTTSEEIGEVLLEKARLALFKGEYAKGEQHATEAIKLDGLPLQTIMSLFQVRGLIRTNLKRYPEAIVDLKTAIGFSDVMHFAHSAFTAYTVLAQAYAYSGDEQNSKNTILIIESILKGFEDNEIWLSRLYECLRAKFHYYNCFGAKTAAYDNLIAAKKIANWIGYKYAEGMCDKSLAEFDFIPSNFVKDYPAWVFFPELQFILIKYPKQIIQLENTPLLTKILKLLCEKEHSLEALFEAVWGLKYKKDLHHKHTHSILSKLRKKLPPGAIIVQDGVIKLN